MVGPAKRRDTIMLYAYNTVKKRKNSVLFIFIIEVMSGCSCLAILHQHMHSYAGIKVLKVVSGYSLAKKMQRLKYFRNKY